MNRGPDISRPKRDAAPAEGASRSHPAHAQEASRSHPAHAEEASRSRPAHAEGTGRGPEGARAAPRRGAAEEAARRDRTRMVREQIAARGLDDEQVLEALRSVPRHRFLPGEMRHLAYEDGALSIGHGQTISQPYMVALMTGLLRLDKSTRLLEVGTGSGYQAAVAAHLCLEVWTVERVAELAARARELLAELGYTTVHVVVGDGSRGLPERAPFGAIVVTAAAPAVPDAWFDQLADGGRLVVPVGAPDRVQTLTVYERHGGRIDRETSVACRFVPLISGGDIAPVAAEEGRTNGAGLPCDLEDADE
jgi:protein-L-isoaspartate(D-aspartate) O-methyltransferase